MRLPPWLRLKHRPEDTRATRTLLRGHGLATVCEEARCPNKSECFKEPTAAFMILGRQCTRNCSFCSVEGGTLHPAPPDPEEPQRVAEAARALGLDYVVVTSVTRDDLADGGAGQFAATVRAVRALLPLSIIEVLTPDFKGDPDNVRTVLQAAPEVFNHNIETVPSLYGRVRPQADYTRSLTVLRLAAQEGGPSGLRVKSGLMLGLGETLEEVREVMEDLRAAGVDSITLGQYLRPTKRELPVAEYLAPEVFERLGEEARQRGFRSVASGPRVRSSMKAGEMYYNSSMNRYRGEGNVNV